MKKAIFLTACLAFLLVSCGGGGSRQTFREAHDAFETKLVKENSDNDGVPEPPKGVFDLVKYPSKVGDLAAYVSCDPGDGQRHPLIIWVVGGWGNGIDDFFWSYAPWDDDQTASAYWEAGVLTMYPSFRGGNGNPGHYEALFGEVDDIVSAYEYAASLPYVDPERIYLGGHSTGATRALLAAEYTDQFRAVFCFGAVDEVKYHNNSQFTFDTSNQEEFVMRSPIHWLEDVGSPTFIIEGSGGNSANVKRIQEASTNENIHCYILEGADHFSVLAPLNELLAQKILDDTGETAGLTLTQEELEAAMAQEPKEPMPLMTQYENKELGLRFSYPLLWGIEDLSSEEELLLSLYSPTNEPNIWDMATAYVDVYATDIPDYLQAFRDYMEGNGYTVQEVEMGGYPALKAVGMDRDSSGSNFNHQVLLGSKDGVFLQFDFYIHESFDDDADPLFQAIADSIELL